MVYWERFALHLPQITQTDIDIIKRDNPLNTALQKQALFHKWLQVYSYASWEHVILALETVDEDKIVQLISNSLPETALSSKWQLTSHQEIIQEATLLTLSELHESFALLLFEYQKAMKTLVKSKQVALSDLVDRIKAESAYSFEDLDCTNDINHFLQHHFSTLPLPLTHIC